MIYQPIFAIVLWVVITLVTPSKVRNFVSGLSAVLIASLLLINTTDSEIFVSNRNKNSYNVAQKVNPEAMKKITLVEWSKLSSELQAAMLMGKE